MEAKETIWKRMYLPAAAAEAPELPFPGGRLPEGCRAAAMVPSGADGAEAGAPMPDPGGTELRLSFAGETRVEPASVKALRIAFAANVREEAELDVFVAGSRKGIGKLDVRYAYSRQIFECGIAPEWKEAVLREGIGLRMSKGTAPVWLLIGEGEDCAALSPHLLLSSDADRLELFARQLKSQVCYHRSGWMEGCVLDGLYDLFRQTDDFSYMVAAQTHLRQFLADSAEEEHTGPRVQNGKIVADIIERTLPYAVLAKLEPGHPAIDELIVYWHAYKREDGSVYDRETDTMTGEGVYTAGYPMAAVAAARGRDDLALLALRQLHSRKERLAADNGIYLRADAKGRRSYLNWARAWAWYLLGAARILIELRDWHRSAPRREYEEGVKEFVRAAAVAASMQQEDGLWPAFTDDPQTGAETGGSAGIAAAFALGARWGLLDGAYRGRAEAAWEGLLRHVTPDGLLGGVSQTNQGGEELQRSGYRVLFQMGMGLVAQLGAALGKRIG